MKIAVNQIRETQEFDKIMIDLIDTHMIDMIGRRMKDKTSRAMRIKKGSRTKNRIETSKSIRQSPEEETAMIDTIKGVSLIVKSLIVMNSKGL